MRQQPPCTVHRLDCCCVPLSLQAASRRLEDDRSQLQEWAARLAVLTREFDAAKEEVKAARTEIQTQRNTLTNQVGLLHCSGCHAGNM